MEISEESWDLRIRQNGWLRDQVAQLSKAMQKIEAESEFHQSRSTAYMPPEEVAELKGRQAAWEDAADIAKEALKTLRET